jgi:hypothetical protein
MDHLERNVENDGEADISNPAVALGDERCG